MVIVCVDDSDIVIMNVSLSWAMDTLVQIKGSWEPVRMGLASKHRSIGEFQRYGRATDGQGVIVG